MSYPAPSRAQLKRLRALHRRRHREENGLFLAEGIRVLEDLVASSLEIDSVVIAPSLEDSERGRALLDHLRSPVFQTSDHELAELADTEAPQGIIAAVRIPRHTLPRSVPAGGLALVLDGIQDPGNFGTLVRGADAFGVAPVIGLPGTVDFWNPKAVRAAAGASFRVPLIAATPAELTAWTADAGVVLWGADAGGADVASVPRPPRLALVLGNEGAGLGGALRAQLDAVVSVPIRGAAESLNVAMAGTVLMHLLTTPGR